MPFSVTSGGGFCICPAPSADRGCCRGHRRGWRAGPLPLTGPWATWQHRTSSFAPPSPTWPPRSCASRPLPRGAPARRDGDGGCNGRVTGDWQPHALPPHCIGLPHCKHPLPWSQLCPVSLHVTLPGRWQAEVSALQGGLDTCGYPAKAWLNCINALEGPKILENFFRRKEPERGT